MISRMKKGFGSYEVLTVCVMLLIIVVVALAYVFKTNYKEKYDVMEYNARMFSLTVSNLYMQEGTQNVYYLQEVIDQRLSSDIKNPFQGDKYCDPLSSKVEIVDDKKLVTLECGNYMVYQQDSLKSPYTIYQVGTWSTNKKDENNQTSVFYNYVENGVSLFEEDLEESIFLYEFNKENGTSYTSISELPNQDNIVQTTMYRHMKKVSD